MMIRFNSAFDASAGNGMESSLKRVSYMLGSSPYLASTYKKAFDDDFSNPALPLDDVIALLQAWRTDLESVIKRCASSFSLESLSRFLAEFEFQRYDEVEVPGQYLLVPPPHIYQIPYPYTFLFSSVTTTTTLSRLSASSRSSRLFVAMAPPSVGFPLGAPMVPCSSLSCKILRPVNLVARRRLCNSSAPSSAL